MSPRARLALVLALVCAAAAWPAAALARPAGFAERLTTARFQVHYNGPSSAGGITAQQAGDLAATAERAYATLVGDWGYVAPLNDGDGRIDLYVRNLPDPIAGLAYTDNVAPLSSSGWLELDFEMGLEEEIVMHELFHLSQIAVDQKTEPWLLEATAEWAGFRFIGFPATYGETPNGMPLPLSTWVGAPDMSLTCTGDHCGLDVFETNGYSRWNFFQFATEKLGSSYVKELIGLGPTHSDALSMLISSLAAKGRTLGDFFTDWTVANIWGDYTAPGLKAQLPKTHSTTYTGIKTGAPPTQRVAVNHLAARYLRFDRGDGASTGPCFAATLSLNVTLPNGLGARPYFYWSNGGKPMPLAISGNTATLTVPWDTCNWEYTGILSLPNPSVVADAQEFVVGGALTVDKSTLVTSSSPPPSKAKGPFIAAPTGEVAPSFSVYGPEVISVSAKATVIRLVVFSSSPGRLAAWLGNTSLQTQNLRTGNNDVRFRLPERASRLAIPRTLKLTSLSPEGEAGATVTKRVVVTRR